MGDKPAPLITNTEGFIVTKDPAKKNEGNDEEALPQWDGRASVEKHCAPCGGMVNGNGCDKPVCPVRGT
jgi:hypothetical protein